MRSTLDPTPRDIWAEVLPARNASNYDFCCLILMVATPLVTDTQIMEVFGKLFSENIVDSKWILEQGESKLEKIFAPLGRQKGTAKYIYGVAKNWKGMPRDYRLLLDFVGVGPKVAIVTIQECLALDQGVACDVHLVRIFQALGWMPTASLSIFDSITLKKDYELARAAIEGWFPPVFWGQLNRTWAGLGQLFRGGPDTVTDMEEWIGREVTDWNSSLRVGDMERLKLVQREHQPRNRYQIE
jgi:endonuclease III